MAVKNIGRARSAVQSMKARLAPGRSMRASARYLKLAAAFPIRPLRSDEELDEAIRVLDRLLSRKKPLDEQEEGYRDSLGNEIRRYEEANVPMPAVTGAAMLRHLIDARDATLSEVAAATGIVVSTISSVLSGKRALNRGHIEKLAAYFGVGAGVFLG
jgi:HTH-type transcriptional regulator/antitoxin HigA